VNGWDTETKTKKLPMLLEGEALVELSTEQQDDYTTTKKAMEKVMLPMNFVSLDDFLRRKLHPGEAISLYVHDLRKLLSHALSDAVQATMEPLLPHSGNS